MVMYAVVRSSSTCATYRSARMASVVASHRLRSIRWLSSSTASIASLINHGMDSSAAAITIAHATSAASSSFRQDTYRQTKRAHVIVAPSAAAALDQTEGVGAPIQVHHHAREECSPFVVLGEVEIIHLESEPDRDIFELSVLRQLLAVVVAPGAEAVNVRRVQHRVVVPDRVTDAGVARIERDIDDIRRLLDARDLGALKKRGAHERVLGRDW